MKRTIFSRLIPAVLFALALVVLPASAQVNSNTQTVALSLSVGESLSLACSPSSLAFTYSGSGGFYNTPQVTCNTIWNLSSSRVNLSLYAFDAGSSLLTGATSGYAESDTNFSLSVDGAGFSTPNNNTLGTGWLVFSQANPVGPGSVSHNISLEFTDISIPADSYSGTLTLQAVAN